ncbi:MAG: hypothetical protein ACFFE4_20600 [Candidatus Thorarchaeota archaeon]
MLDNSKKIVRKLTKPILIVVIASSPLLIGFGLYVNEFSPISLDIRWHVNPFEIDIDDFKLKNVLYMEMVGPPKIGFNTLKVSWPIWSDCGLPKLEIIQYNIFSRQINIWIYGVWAICIQVIAFVDYNIEIFIPYSGYWKISCNNVSINIMI